MRTWDSASRLAAGLGALVLLGANTRAAGLNAAFDKDGLSALTWQSDELLTGGRVELADLKVAGGDAPAGAFDRRGPDFDAAHHTVENDYNWGKIRITYRPVADGLMMDVEVTNSSTRPLTHVAFTALKFQFPQTPKGVDWEKRYLISNDNPDEIPLIMAEWAGGKLAFCRDDAGPGPLSIGLQPLGDKPYGLIIGFGKEPILPRATRRASVSIRLGDPTTPTKSLTGDISVAFAKKHPSTLVWKDRRPIGSAFLSTSVAGYKNNPRGWLLDPEMDVTTPAGRVIFKTKMMAYADSVVAHCKQMDAQGVIVWDLEGQEMPHATSYIADPRMLSKVAPEMEAIADAFMKKFSDAGLRTGLTIRPTKVTKADKGRPGWMQADVKDQVAEIDAKLKYAEKRWGCTLFYVDSNVDFVKDPNDGHVTGDPAMVAAGFKLLAQHHPNALLMPEHKTAAYWASVAPYSEFRLGYNGTPSIVRDAYPTAFSVMQVVDGPDLKSPEAVSTLTAAVKNGDILLFRPWWDDPQSADIQTILKQALGGAVQ
ncbi:MAG: Ig domain protein group 2 domain protein [Phycisphaerales bacterium]|nr:Ig domain protein group 2 domain protein [Phycisphaerales bacterium]